MGAGVRSTEVAGPRFAFPPDSPGAIDHVSRGLRTKALRARTAEADLRATYRAVASSWTGAAGEAAQHRFSRLAEQAAEIGTALDDSVAAVRTYHGQVTEARAAIMEIRARYRLVSARIAVLDTELTWPVAEGSVAVGAQTTNRATALLDEAVACEVAYRAVMRRVSGAADHCSQALLDRAGVRSEAGATAVRSVVGATAGREDPNDRILREYQVTADPDGMIDWEPSGFNGWVASLFRDDAAPQRMTEHEGTMLDKRPPEDLYMLEKIKKRAEDEASSRFDPSPAGRGNSDHLDAFRHAYWSAGQTQYLGSKWTEEYTTSHERTVDNEPEREAMDLYNNEVGRRIAAENKFLDDEDLAQKVEEAIENGEMLVIGPGGRLYWSDEVTQDEAGQLPAHTNPSPGHKNAPDNHNDTY